MNLGFVLFVIKNMVLFKNEKGNIFGGYASISWKNKGKYQSAPDSFIFTLTNIHNIEPIKFPSKNDKNEVYHSINKGPLFGGGRDLGIDKDFSQHQSCTDFPFSYKDISGKGKSIFTGDFNNNNKNIRL